MLHTLDEFKELSARRRKPRPRTCGHCKLHSRVHKLDVAGCGHVVLCDECHQLMRDRKPSAAMAATYRTIMCPYCGGREQLEPAAEAETPPIVESPRRAAGPAMPSSTSGSSCGGLDLRGGDIGARARPAAALALGHLARPGWCEKPPA